MAASRPTITLAVIAKNEEKNVNRLLDSVEGCFDQIVFVDTGSTDRTVEIAEKRGCEIHHFQWINDFAKARNFAFSKATSDYVMWLDLDDVLSDREGFIKWRDGAMQFHDMWFANYQYALDETGKPVIAFVRERAFRRSIVPTWQYFIHEGVIAQAQWTKAQVWTWLVKHLRDQEDIKADRSRNIGIFEAKMKDEPLDARMQFYFGKELFEAGRHVEAVIALKDAVGRPGLEAHDRVLSYQYAAYAEMQLGDQLKDELAEQKREHWMKGVHLAVDGLKYDPNRAEFHVTIGDAYLKRGELVKAIPHYGAAKVCVNATPASSVSQGAIFSFGALYGEVPTLQLAKIYFNLGKLEEAKAEALECAVKFKNQEAEAILLELERIKGLVDINGRQEDVSDIVITCPPQSAYEFDEELIKTRGMGGSETALIEMAKELRRLCPHRAVKVFNMRQNDLVSDSGVEYISNAKAMTYLSQNRPAAHIAWRHNVEMTSAPTYLWCHDLVTPSVETSRKFKKIMCLSKFHKSYVQGMQGVPEDQIMVTRNGIIPSKFEFIPREKNENKIVWMSSPDRGLDRAMIVCDEIRKERPDVELHVYYGLENLYKYGLADLARRLEAMMKERPWVKYHGFTEQQKMYRDVSDAVLWLHPCNFIETFCITALEMLALGIYPVTRRLGALANTLAEAETLGQATMLDHDCITEAEVAAYAGAALMALDEKAWRKVSLDIERHSWRQIAAEWVDEMGL